MSVILVQENPSDGARSYMYVLENDKYLRITVHIKQKITNPWRTGRPL